MRRTHGMSHTRLHNIWLTMRQRCEKPRCSAYQKYGAKGIKICEEWGSFEVFRDWALTNGYTDALTIDRINTKGNYEPSNCRWVTQKVQQNNRSNNVTLSCNGVTKTLYEWSTEVDIPARNLYDRFKKGWSTQRILEQPLRKSPTVRPIRDKVRPKIKITYGEITKTIPEWASLLGISRRVLYDRYRRGWAVERIFEQAVRRSPTPKGASV